MATIFEEIEGWFTDYSILVLGFLFVLIGLFFGIPKVKNYLKNKSNQYSALLWVLVLASGILMIIFSNSLQTYYDETLASSFHDLEIWFTDNSIIGLGLLLVVAGLLFGISELNIYLKHNSTPDQLILWSMVFLAGMITTIFNDFVFGLLVGISIIMLIETVKLWDTPVWGQLMAATTASYLVILFGKAGQIAFDYITKPENPNEQIFSTAFNISFYVFIIVAFFFFGRKFILVSRLSSPQMVYLFLFGMMYGVIVFLQKREILFSRDEQGYTQAYNYLNINANWPDRIMFANFGTFEALAVVMVFMYLISGWLLEVLFGIEPVTDPIILAKVAEVAKTMGIKDKVKVGFVRAPILNAFAFGPFFDKRIAFISNDINEFSDSDIRGIVGHELAHSAKHHVVLLLLLSIFELAFKKALGFPATTLDYTFLPDDAVKNISFGAYYGLSYLFLIFLLIFVRILEGHADKVTKDAGYGDDLSKALFRLEGFYHGVASDFGISVNLLTDRQYSPAERRRFTAQAGKNLYSEILSPTRGSAFANVFQSHPRTAYRISAMASENVSPIKAALYPYRLLGFGLRKGALKKLTENYQIIHSLIDETYTEDYGEEALDEVLNFNPMRDTYERYIGKSIIAFDKFEKRVYNGECKDIISTGRVTSPLFCIINDEKVDLAKVAMKEYKIGESYFLRDGSIVVATGHHIDKEKGLIIDIENNGRIEEIEIAKLGKPVTFISNLSGKEIIVYDKGLSKLKKIDTVDLGKSWADSKIKINGDTFNGVDFIVGFPPLGIETRKTKIDEQMDLLKHLVGKKIYLYTKENFDVSLSGLVESVNDNGLTLLDADGSHTIELNKLEYVIYEDDVIELIRSEHISFFTKIEIKWSNRNEFNYIIN
ncbi:MAG: Protease HtpX [Candidatus Heimdallarchaeota archaeon LC_2]|nr:MAG: Protease HtpX [Candidatus Heimdallarchaeota archaeon LC_2]